jgi:NADPH:quinone reductase-like Zn-dependent oxidoreductase
MQCTQPSNGANFLLENNGTRKDDMSYQRVVITKFGGPEVLKVILENDLPFPKHGEVLIRMLATSACFTDTMIRRGIYYGINQKPPFSPGYDVIGVVEKLGAGVADLQVGQQVAELTVTGAYSEYLCVPAGNCVPVPDGINPALAVSMVLTYLTSYQMLHRMAKIKRGARILVHGASGATGSALVQLGKLYDLEMYGTATAANRELVVSLGAVPIDYQNEDFVERIESLTPKGVDVVFDAIGGSNFRRSFNCLRKGGMLVAYGSYNSVVGREGSSSSSYADLMLRNLLPNGKSAAIYSIAPLKKKHPEWFRQDLTELFLLLEEGRVEPVISKRLKLTEAALAHQLLEERGVKGKIILLS